MKLFRTVLALAATACGATSFSEAEQANGCEAYVSAQIAHGDRCRDALQARSGLPGKANLVALCSKSVAAADNAVTPNIMNACAAALKDATCDKNEADVEPCRNMHQATGGVEIGVLCTFSTQCKSGLCVGSSVDDKGVRCGNCTEPIPIGGACNIKGLVPCVREANCVAPQAPPGTPPGTGGVCTGFLGEGNACDGRHLCGSGLYCAAMEKTCKKLGTLAAPCDPRETQACAGALVCFEGKCAVRLPEGAACKREGDCDVLLRCANGVCAAPAPAKIGELCEGRSCAADAACRNQICVARKALGATCDPNTDVCGVSAACLQGTCQIPDPGICK